MKIIWKFIALIIFIAISTGTVAKQKVCNTGTESVFYIKQSQQEHRSGNYSYEGFWEIKPGECAKVWVAPGTDAFLAFLDNDRKHWLDFSTVDLKSSSSQRDNFWVTKSVIHNCVKPKGRFKHKKGKRDGSWNWATSEECGSLPIVPMQVNIEQCRLEKNGYGQVINNSQNRTCSNRYDGKLKLNFDNIPRRKLVSPNWGESISGDYYCVYRGDFKTSYSALSIKEGEAYVYYPGEDGGLGPTRRAYSVIKDELLFKLESKKHSEEYIKVGELLVGVWSFSRSARTCDKDHPKQAKSIIKAYHQIQTELPSVYKEVNNGSILEDTSTGMQWMRCTYPTKWKNGKCVGKPKAMTYSEAVTLAESYEQAGLNAWRIPTSNQIFTIIKCRDAVPAEKYWFCTVKAEISPTVHSVAFPNTLKSNYWIQAYKKKPGVVDFATGNPVYDAEDRKYYLRLVRGRNFRNR